jgi:heat shock protein HslJ
VHQQLQHHHWVLTHLDGEPIASHHNDTPDLEIGEHFTINSIAGCNRYVGQAHLQKNTFWATDIIRSDRACPAPFDAIEQAVLMTLTEGATLSGTVNRLILQGKKHQLEYQLRDWVL